MPQSVTKLLLSVNQGQPHSSSCAFAAHHLVHLSDPGLGEGRAYCFLPLPVKTGLSAVHINGLFELSRLVSPFALSTWCNIVAFVRPVEELSSLLRF
jgi:hypothetical protein